jgi:hypothetical protein
MKFRPEYVIPIVILVTVILISLCDSCLYFMPYDPEGFDNINIPLSSSDVSGKSTTPAGSLFSASAPVQTTAGNVAAVTGSAKIATTRGKEGFETLEQATAVYGPELPVDSFSKDNGDLTCEASPYSNSKGYLCMDKNQISALKTRGFNQTGGN